MKIKKESVLQESPHYASYNARRWQWLIGSFSNKTVNIVVVSKNVRLFMYPRCIIFELEQKKKNKLHNVNRFNLFFNTQIHVEIKKRETSDETCRGVHAYCYIPIQTCKRLIHLNTSTLILFRVACDIAISW